MLRLLPCQPFSVKLDIPLHNCAEHVPEKWKLEKMVGWWHLHCNTAHGGLKFEKIADICLPNRPKIFRFFQYSLIHDLALSLIYFNIFFFFCPIWICAYTYTIQIMYGRNGLKEMFFWNGIMWYMISWVKSHELICIKNFVERTEKYYLPVLYLSFMIPHHVKKRQKTKIDM